MNVPVTSVLLRGIQSRLSVDAVFPRFHSAIAYLLPDTLPICASCSVSLEQRRLRQNYATASDARNRYLTTRTHLAAPREEMMEKMKTLAAPLKENIFTVPNALCVIRIGLTPYVGYLIMTGDFKQACWVFAFAGFTDLLDGFIARQFPSQRSMIGSFLDPLADKLLVTTLVLTLTAVHLIPFPLTALIVLRDVLLIAAASVIRYRSIPPPVTLTKYFDATYASASLSPTTISKWNTALQMLLVVSTLGAPVFNYIDHPALHALWYVSAASTVVSGLSYAFQKGTYSLRRKPPQS